MFARRVFTGWSLKHNIRRRLCMKYSIASFSPFSTKEDPHIFEDKLYQIPYVFSQEEAFDKFDRASMNFISNVNYSYYI